ncbi:MAG: hypothetical protein CL566_00525 [Alphaproteobacteria bacterium]|nr:hypothetical protein [Alphaproteobacteria bacterium]
MSDPEILVPDEAFEEPRRGRSPVAKLAARTTIVAGVVVLGGVVWFAYQQGIKSGAEEAAPVITADGEPFKRKPKKPGGLDVPHQDKLVFNRLAPGQVEEPVEKLLPPPEEPAERPEASVDTAAASVEEVVETEPEPPAPPARPTAAPPPPEPVMVTPPPVPAPPPAKAAEPEGDRWRIQLASVSSRDRALSEWDRLKTRNTDLLGTLKLNVESAKLSNGTFYRIQAGPLAGRLAASDLCGELKSRNQDCLIVAP